MLPLVTLRVLDFLATVDNLLPRPGRELRLDKLPRSSVPLLDRVATYLTFRADRGGPTSYGVSA